MSNHLRLLVYKILQELMDMLMPRHSTFTTIKMDAPYSTPDQEAEGEQQPSALPIVCEKDNSQETSDHAPMVSGTARLRMLLLTIAALYLATGS